jgi:hypothetical protein
MAEIGKPVRRRVLVPDDLLAEPPLPTPPPKPMPATEPKEPEPA